MIPGVAVGHWTDEAARTGCTVVLLPEGTVASGEVRGGAPASRETDLLAPERLVQRVDAVLLTGGSAFGLAAADGVVAWLEAQGRGFPTPVGPVPIVVALGVFDLAEGSASVRPTAPSGRAACEAAGSGPVPGGRVGAGTGATTAKWRGPGGRRPGGLGVDVRRDGDLLVAALAVVNAFGEVVPEGAVPPADLPPTRTPPAAFGAGAGAGAGAGPGENTTVGVVVTNARLDKVGCLAVAAGAHDGLARAVHPPHTSVDGDAVVAAATGEVDAPTDRARALAVTAFAAAVRAAVPPPAPGP